MRAKSAALKRRRRVAAVMVTVGLLAFFIPAVRFFRSLTGAMAVSNAADLINRTVSGVVETKMQDLAGSESAFISFEKDESGNITAIVTDTARVNVLSSELLSAVVAASDAGDLNLRVPLGDLLGISLFLGKGPRIPVRITLLTSSRVEVRNVLTDAGINQTRHQLLLAIRVDADVLLPWEIRSARIEVPVLVAENVIVGRVPQTYVTMENKGE
jgi:sporulation protein YunB